MSRQFFSGNSIEQAIMAAARHHGIEPETVAYTSRDKKHGFLNIRRRVVIEVDPENPQLAGGTSAPVSKPKAKEAPAAVEEEATHERGDEAADVHLEEEHDVESGDFEEDSEEEDDEGNEDDGDVDDDDVDDDDEDDDEDDEAGDDDGTPVRPPESARGRGDRGARGEGRRGRQGSDAVSRDRDEGRQTADRKQPARAGKKDEADRDNVRMYRGVIVEWKDEVELDGVSRELAAFEFAVEQILDVMDLEIEYTIVEGETFKIEFSGEDSDLLTEDDGRVLKAFEHILPRIVRGLVGDSLNCKVDCEGFRAEHEDKLVEQAQEAADEVRESGDAKTLPQMNPSDRRIIHLALVNDPDVETVSQGRGYMKRVRIQLLEED